MEEENPFEEYYKETFKQEPAQKPVPAPAGKENEAFLESLEEKFKKKDVTGDADTIRVSINAFIKDMRLLVGKVFAQEKAKGTRLDLIVTILVGGIAYTLAYVYRLIKKDLKLKMGPQEYEITLVEMYRSALTNLEKESD